jgi:CRP-like cAMP-binding protein
MTQGRHSAVVIHLSAQERSHLEHLQRCTTARMGVIRRARMLLLLDEGRTITDIARLVGLTRRFVYKWVARWRASGVAGLEDRRGRGRKAPGAIRREEHGHA